MKKIVTLIFIIIALCVFLSGCTSKPPISILLDGGGVNLSESTKEQSVKELENSLREIKLKNSNVPLFEDILITENTGIFYNSYTFMATTKPQKLSSELNLTLTMPGTPVQTKNGVTQNQKVVFNIRDLSEAMELKAESESNNTGVMLGIIAVLVLIMGGFLFLVKRGGGDYGNY
jgi:hypothetical protein